MGVLITSILRIASYVFAGVGVSEFLDKFIKPKVPATVYPEPIGIGWKIPRLLWIVVAFVAGIMLLRFLGKKLKISFLK